MTSGASEERRRNLVALLRKAGGPVRGVDLAAELGVSRQVVVHDMAVLRAEGQPMIGSPQGYRLLLEAGPPGRLAVLACKHDRESSRTELYALVDHGLTVIDVVVDHPLYGELRGNLMIASRQDVDRFLDALDREHAELLSALTGGVHLHTVRAPDDEALEAAREALREAGILL